MKQLVIRVFIIIIIFPQVLIAQHQFNKIGFFVSMPDATKNIVHIKMVIPHQAKEQLTVKIPKWTTGYYQIMDYDKNISHFSVSKSNPSFKVTQLNNNSWLIQNTRNKEVTIEYDVKANKNFVANSFIDSTHAFLLFSSLLLYIENELSNEATVSIHLPRDWKDIATGLTKLNDNTYYAKNFDVLYDSPMLLGNLESLPSFEINQKLHRFIGYQLGDFDKQIFMNDLQKIVITATNIFNDIPYNEYTFLAIGPGRGGIEHTNSAAVSFSGNDLNTQGGKNKMMTFLTHEYFHHFNIKRIRPLELGPFDYDKENRTNLLWLSEGLSVYYEYLIANRAGVINENMILGNFEKNISNHENNPGKHFQSLIQASYDTWNDGPFGTSGSDPNKAISYYEKGPIIGLILDIAIRKSTNNQKSLDNVMHDIYWQYYKKLGRGLTDAEFQEACEKIAGKSINEVFEYIYTTKEINYTKYLHFAGLQLQIIEGPNNKNSYKLLKETTLDSSQIEIYKSLFQ